MAYTYLSRTLGTATNRKKFTISLWFKKVSNSGTQQFLDTRVDSNNQDGFKIHSSQALKINGYESSTTYELQTNAILRDTSAWYHAVVSFDSTQSTSTDRLKMYLNGEQITSFSGATYPSLNFEPLLNKNIAHFIGSTGTSNYFDGAMSHFHFIDGTAYDASAFGSTDSTTGEWQINTSPSVTYGTNGFFILKDGNSVTDQSGKGNNFTVGGGTLTKTEDNPSNVFATINPLANFYAGSSFTYGNTETAMPAANNSFNISTIGMSSTSGKFYAEVKMIAPSQYTEIGISSGESTSASGGLGRTTSVSGNYEWGYTNGNQVVRHNGSAIAGWSGANYSTNDVVGVALDNDNQKIYWSVNGVYQNSGDPTSGATGTGALSTSTVPSFYLFAGGDNHSGGDPTNTILQWNFGNGYFGTTAVSSAGTNASGNGIFEYNVPAGYTALSTKGLNL